MKFKFDQNYKKVSDLVKMMKEGELVVDHSYQRKSVWGEKDQVRLIETILLNLVIPSVYFWNSETDPETGDSKVHIVDGQQRLNAISSFVKGNGFRLKEDYLLEEESKKLFGNKTFHELDKEQKKDLWEYKLSVIEIERTATMDDVKKMFTRLNLTDYNLNGQEKRNVKDGEFASLANELSENDFWSRNELFNAGVIKRMKDVEFCASLILLYKKGIIDQVNDKELNLAYDDYAVGYDDAVSDREGILNGMDEVQKLISSETKKFLKRTNQLYTVFSVVFYLISNDLEVDEKIIHNFKLFVQTYDNYKNEENAKLDLEENERRIYDQIKKYKQASSEGVKKYTNRMARFSVLKNILLQEGKSDEVFERLNKKLLE